MKPVTLTLSTAVLSVFLFGCSSSSDATSPILDVDEIGSTSINSEQLETQLSTIPAGEISADEEAGLTYMREEEKLAHDVYIVLFNQQDQKIFQNIANSETTHTEAIKTLIERYHLTDPVGNNPEGVFTDITLQSLYDTLVAQGSASLIDALLVGAAIEELDIIDIETRQLDVIDNDDIILVYDNLIKGSRNHLRAFVRNLDNQGETYVPQYLSQAVYDEIINSSNKN